MNPNPLSTLARLLSLGILLAAALLTAWSGVRAFAAPSGALPPGSQIAAVPVGGLDEAAARQRLQAVYEAPLELDYRGNRIQVSAQELGFSLHLDAMLAQAREGSRPTWRERFGSILWNRPGPGPVEVPLAFGFAPEQARAYLEEQLAPRYDNPPAPPMPRGDTQILPGSPGWTLDVESSLALIAAALQSPAERRVSLPVNESPAPAMPLENLQALLAHLVQQDGFDGLVDVALTDLQSGRRLYFAVQNGQFLDPEIAFTAASTIKIPIMLSVLRRTGEPTPQQARDWLERMSVYSENPPADALMETYVAEMRGPLVVSADLQELGLKNTFLAGYFYTGAPLLERYETPANSRSDVNLRPDIYNQTTPGEMNDLIAWIYRCARQNRGPVVEKFGGAVSQAECRLILDEMGRNRHGMLIEAGLPEDISLAHKHGWVEEADGLLHTMSDTAIVYTPGGDYALSIYLYRTQQLVFDPANVLVARLSQAVYNTFNVERQEPWQPYKTGEP